MLGTISHVVICVKDLPRSVSFYEQLGFSKFFEFESENEIAGAVLGLDLKKVRMAFMRPEDNKDAVFLDIVEFVDPPTKGDSYPSPNYQGITRIAFAVNDLESTYAHLQELGVEFITPLQRYPGPDGKEQGMVCFRDPDGVYLEIISPRPGFHKVEGR